MSHELELDSLGQAQMFFVGDVPPWHGLGKKLDRPPTIQEAIVCAGLDWTVERKRLVLEGTDTKVPAFANVRSTDSSILGVVGTGYRPVQNVDAFKWFQPWVDAKEVTLDTAGSLKNGRHVWVLAQINRDPVEVVKDDPIVRYILVSNSHDGSRMVRAGFTGTRVVCWNTVNAALTSKQSKLLKVRHTENAEESLQDIQQVMNLADKRFMATIEQMRSMARKGVTTSSLLEYVTQVFRPKPVLNEIDAEEMPEEEERCERLVGKIIPLFEGGRGNELPGVKGTMWAAYNAVTEYLTWTRGRNVDNRLTSLWLGDGQAVAQRAFDVAARMAA
jgi:phage/plasmid-like protein (TIGR03299 family)